jgi:hypothetical protein
MYLMSPDRFLVAYHTDYYINGYSLRQSVYQEVIVLRL